MLGTSKIIRKKFSLIALLILTICIISSSSGEELGEYEEEVMSILKSENYSRNLLPPLGRNKTNRKLFINLNLREIETLDDKKMELKAQFALRQKWTDIRLKYNSSGNGFVTVLGDSSNLPWMPDTFVHNEKESLLHSTSRPNAYFRIFPNGSILYSVRLSTTISCLMDLRRFPFDEQPCQIRLSSFAYTKSSLELVWDPSFSLEVIGSYHLTQFKLVGQMTGACFTSHRATGKYSTVFVILHFQRQIGYYFFIYFCPISMCVALTWISFWLGPAIEARLALTVTGLLTMTTQISGGVGTLTQVSYVTAFSTFTGISIFFGALSIVQSAFVFTVIRKNHLQANSHKVMDFVESGRKKTMDNEVGTRKALFPMTAERVDQISKIVFPTMYILFLITYTVIFYKFPNIQFDYAGDDSTKRCKS